MEGPRHREVVDVVSNLVGKRPCLPPTSHAAVDKFWIGRQADLRTEAKALHNSRSKTLYQGVGLFDQPQHCGSRPWRLEIDAYGSSTPIRDRETRVSFNTEIRDFGAVQSDHLRTHIRQHRGAKWNRADRPEFNDFVSVQWAQVSSPLAL